MYEGNHFLNKLFENAPIGIFFLSALKSEDNILDFEIKRANLRSSVIFNQISFIDKRLSSVLGYENITNLLKEHKSIKQGEEFYEWEDKIRGKELNFKLFNLTDNQKCLMISNIIASEKLVSELKNNENYLKEKNKTLRELNATLIELNETKDKILSTIASDLTIPFKSGDKLESLFTTNNMGNLSKLKIDGLSSGLNP